MNHLVRFKDLSPRETKKSMTSEELNQLEKAFEKGLSSSQILEVFAQWGSPLSEATLRKYVQLGLLPRSVRVGEKGKHRGSKGVYPARVLRLIVVIRQLMALGLTIEEIKAGAFEFRGQIDELDSMLRGLFEKMTLSASEGGARSSAKVTAMELAAVKLLGRLRGFEAKRSAQMLPQSAQQVLALLNVEESNEESSVDEWTVRGDAAVGVAV